jgi:uncharacterized repeat protein (TIGR03803 family)
MSHISRSRSEHRPASLYFVLGCALWFAFSFRPSLLRAQTPIYTDLHDFDCLTEGCEPDYPAVLAQGRDGNLYGTTANGGTSGAGTVFKLTPSGAVTTLHNFSGSDGNLPFGGLTLGPDGNFYGSTRLGGASGGGTIFKITSAGTLTTLHSFDGSDGASPWGAPVLGKNGKLYGTTCGFNLPTTAYSITLAGKFKTINSSFVPCPQAPLLLGSDGNFYGTSPSGGIVDGTVFRMTTAGTIKIIANFTGPNGSAPFSPMAQGNDGVLYGTTTAGGSGQGGVVFKLNTTGKKFTLLRQFDPTDPADGVTPFAGLVAANDGKFYGTTISGGNEPGAGGIIFQIDSKGDYSVVHNFDITHGGGPMATSTQHTNGAIYGLTESGGAFNGGVVFSLNMGLPPFAILQTLWGTAGQTVEILGNGLTGTSSVKFGSGSATFNVISDTYMTAVVPADGTADFVTVTTPSGTLTSNRRFNVVPFVGSFAPPSGSVGTQVTITGSGFVGATQVKFGGVKSSFTVNGGTQITATVPPGAKTGKIAVTTPGGSGSSKITFRVTP